MELGATADHLAATRADAGPETWPSAESDTKEDVVTESRLDRARCASSAPACSARASALGLARARHRRRPRRRVAVARCASPIDYGAGRAAGRRRRSAAHRRRGAARCHRRRRRARARAHSRTRSSPTSRASSSSRSRARATRGADLTRYIGSHPLAGRERGGPISARADIFVGRPVGRLPRTTTSRYRARRSIEDLDPRPRRDAASR